MDVESGTTYEQNLLGPYTIDTIDPRNIEAILSSKFDGKEFPSDL